MSLLAISPQFTRADEPAGVVEFGCEVGFVIVKDKNWFFPPAARSGGVLALPAIAGGFDEANSAFVNRATPGVPGEPTASDQFGGAFACGDYDHDGKTDLVVGTAHRLLSGELGSDWIELPVETLAIEAGRDRVYVSARDGTLRIFDLRSGTIKEVDSFGLPSPQSALAAGVTAAPAKQPGVVLAVGRRNADGFEDLVVGVPSQTVNGKKNAGAVYEYLGSATGIKHTPSKIYRRGLNKVPGSPLANEYFGAQVALIDFDHKGIDNLFIGVPDAFNKTGAFYAEKNDKTFFAQTLAGGALPGTLFGWAFGKTNLNGDAFPDFVVGVPGFKSGTVENAGAAYLYTGGATTPTYLRAIVAAAALGQTTPLAFGASIRAFDLLGRGTDQLFVGAPCYDLPGKKDAGAIVPLDLAGFFAPIHLDRGAIAGDAAPNDHLGSGNGSSLLASSQRVTALCAGQ